MHLSVGSCVLLVVICGAVGTTRYQLKSSHMAAHTGLFSVVEKRDINQSLQHKSTRDIYGSAAGTRMRRSLVKAGAAALLRLFRQAKRLYSNGYDTVFVKIGGLKKAERDFMSMRPDDVQEIKVGGKVVRKTGNVGKVRLQLQSNGDRPTLTISKLAEETDRYRSKPRINDVIVYID